METKKRKKGETAQRIYKLLYRNPDLTTNELCLHMPDLEAGTVQVAVSRMLQRGEIGSRGKKYETSGTGRTMPHRTYHVKRKVKPAPQPVAKPTPKPVAKPAPKVEAPRVHWADVASTPKKAPKPAWTPPPVKPEPEGPTTPHAEREVLVLRHLADIYKSMNMMTEQQEALIQVLKGTLLDLAETKQELEEAQKARGFWGTIKGWFS